EAERAVALDRRRDARVDVEQPPRSRHHPDMPGDPSLAHQDDIEGALAPRRHRPPGPRLAGDQPPDLPRVGRGDVAIRMRRQVDRTESVIDEAHKSPTIAAVDAPPLVAERNADEVGKVRHPPGT